MPQLVHKPKRKALLIAAGALGLVAFGALSGAIILLSGAYSTAATTQHFKVTHQVLDAGLRLSVRASARHVRAPDLDRPGMLARGVACFRTHCVQCHGAPGVAPIPAARGMLPIASNLTQTAREWPPEWLYYVTRKGVRMTGMPAWEMRIDEDDLWATVSFLTRLPVLTREQYRRLATRAEDLTCRTPTGVPFEGSREYAKVIFRQYACHSCHRIEGVVGPRAHIGPSLLEWSRRKFVAGVLPNDERNLIRFIRDPGRVKPGSLMPRLEVTEAHAREMARYLLDEGAR